VRFTFFTVEKCVITVFIHFFLGCYNVVSSMASHYHWKRSTRRFFWKSFFRFTKWKAYLSTILSWHIVLSNSLKRILPLQNQSLCPFWSFGRKLIPLKKYSLFIVFPNIILYFGCWGSWKNGQVFFGTLTRDFPQRARVSWQVYFLVYRGLLTTPTTAK